MFRFVLPPIIRSAYNCIYSIWYLSHRYCYLPLSWKRWNRFECAVGGVRPKHVEQFPDINKRCNIASCWIYSYIGILLGARPILYISRIRVNPFCTESQCLCKSALYLSFTPIPSKIICICYLPNFLTFKNRASYI
jgi:hypothetical protein